MTAPRTGTLYWLPRILADESLDPTSTLLMIGLADHVNADDECWVGIERLSEMARVSYGTARRRLTELEKAGRIVRSRMRRGDGNLSVYIYRLVRGPESEPSRSLRDDQSPPGRAVTSARQDARTEVPSAEPPCDEQPLFAQDGDPAAGFDAFWSLYPKRNGKRVGRAKAEALWARLAAADRALVMVAVGHYAAACNGGVTLAKDAERWLRDRELWTETWQTPAQPRTDGPKRATVAGMDSDRDAPAGRLDL